MNTSFIIQTALEIMKQYPWFGVISSVIATASAISAITQTPKKGTFLSKAYKVIDILAINVGKAKQTGE